MRWVFGFLVLANLALLMWASWYRDTGDEPGYHARPPVNARALRLLSESEVKLSPRTPGKSTQRLAPVISKSGAAGTACFIIGPFSEISDVKKAESRLQALPASFVRREKTEVVVSGYRVYLPPLPSRREALRKSRELGRLGIKDRVVMQEQGMMHAISLGVYHRKEHARWRMRVLAKKGVRTRIQTLRRSRRTYWLDLPAQSLTADALPVRQWELEGVEVKRVSCPAKPAGNG